METGRSVTTGLMAQPLAQALVAYAAFGALSLLSRLIPVLFLLVVAVGIAFPLLWARWSGEPAAVGFTRQKMRQALTCGVGSGLIGSATVLFNAWRNPYPEQLMPGVQLAIGIPLWLLILSPFQEFFFRGWLQPRFEEGLGRWVGLVVTAVLFAAWHFLAPFQGGIGSQLDLATLSSIGTMLGMGLVFGYIFQRSRNIVAPWLGHALMGIALVAVGGMTFLQVS